MQRTGIPRKVLIVAGLQFAAIILATLLGVYGAASVLQNVLIKRALDGEAEYFWKRYADNPKIAVPDTNNLIGYLVRKKDDLARLPATLRDFDPGYHRLAGDGDDSLILVSDGPDARLFLIFNQQQVTRLAWLFGFLPLTAVLLMLYTTTWLTYRASRRALSPVIALAKTVREWDPKQPDLAQLDSLMLSNDPDGDVQTLARALHGFASRIEGLVERERNFTRDASHELRSPLTVVKLAADVLLDEELTPFAQRAVERVRRSVAEMEAMIEAFLILAREADTGMPEEEFLVNQSVREEIERAQVLLVNKPVALELHEPESFTLRAPPRVFAVLIGNLIRNACLYTDAGRVAVTIGANFVRIDDSGVGMSAVDLQKAFTPFYRGSRSVAGGFGIGLSLVRRLSERFAWSVDMHSTLAVGTSVTVKFPQARRVVPSVSQLSAADG